MNGRNQTSFGSCRRWVVYLKEKQEVQCSNKGPRNKKNFNLFVEHYIWWSSFLVLLIIYSFQQIGHFWPSLLLWKGKAESCKYFLNISPINLLLFIFTPSCSHPSPRPHHLLPEIRLWVPTDLWPPFLADVIQFPCSVKEHVFLIQI